jgi:peptide/nickel transport system substrate-binding protein
MDAEVRKIDDYTVDFLLKSPNPILNAEWDSWFIMSRTWSERHNAE